MFQATHRGRSRQIIPVIEFGSDEYLLNMDENISAQLTFGRIRSGRGWLGLALVAGVGGGDGLRLAGASTDSAGRDRFTNASIGDSFD